MRTWRYGAVRSLVVMVIAGLCWCAGTRQIPIAPREERAVSEVTTNSDLRAALVRYREEKDYRTKCEIAKSFAASRSHLWEECVQRRMTPKEDERKALFHFTDAYFKRGPQQKEELISLLHSQDVELVGWLLLLLTETSELGPNGEWQPNKGLGGSEIAHHIASVYNTHPSLAWGVASALHHYGSAAKSEVRTLLRIVLSWDEMEVLIAKIALREIDSDGVYSQFGLDPTDAPLTDEQRTAIEKHLALQGV